MSRVRVLRVLEYEYADLETAIKDVARFQVPAQGHYPSNPGWQTRPIVIRSAIIGGVAGFVSLDDLGISKDGDSASDE